MAAYAQRALKLALRRIIFLFLVVVATMLGCIIDAVFKSLVRSGRIGPTDSSVAAMLLVGVTARFACCAQLVARGVEGVVW